MVETSRHTHTHPIPTVFVFASGYCGGPEWAERIAFNSKPIRMHFCCTPPFDHPPLPISSLGRLSRTDDVTDCCEHCFHGNAYHRFGLHFRELSLHSPTPPPLTSHTLRPPPRHPAYRTPSSDESRREVGGAGGGRGLVCVWRGGGGKDSLLWTGRTS